MRAIHLLVFIVLLTLVLPVEAQLLKTRTSTPEIVVPAKGVTPADPWDVYDDRRARYDALDQNVSCPALPKKIGEKLPTPPYDLERGDCALRGRGEEIEAYLTALERMAAGCQARRDTAWQAVQEARENLDAQIDALEEPPERPTTPRESEGMESLLSEPVPSMCPSYPSSIGSLEPSEGIEPEGFYYTYWLQRIAENTAKYCRLIDELIKPIWEACDMVNFYIDCEDVTAARKTSFHGLVSGKMNAAELQYEYTDFFYTNTLQQYGWGNFRQYFNEGSLSECSAGEAGLRVTPAIERGMLKLKRRTGKEVKVKRPKKGGKASVKKVRAKVPTKTRAK